MPAKHIEIYWKNFQKLAARTTPSRKKSVDVSACTKPATSCRTRNPDGLQAQAGTRNFQERQVRPSKTLELVTGRDVIHLLIARDHANRYHLFRNAESELDYALSEIDRVQEADLTSDAMVKSLEAARTRKLVEDTLIVQIETYVSRSVNDFRTLQQGYCRRLQHDVM